MHPDAAAHLWDASSAGHLVEEFVAGTSVDQYIGDALLRSAVERQLAIVGEALNKLSKVDAATAGAITDMRRIVETSLPRLLDEVDTLLTGLADGV